MRATVRNGVTFEAAARAEPGRSDWGALPLWVAAAIQGVPLNLVLFPRDTPSAQRVYEENYQLLTTTGLGASLVPLTVWGVLYVVSGAYVFRRGLSGIRRGGLVLMLAIIALVAASALWSLFPVKVYFFAAHSVGAMLIATAAALRYRGDPARLASALGAAFGTAVTIHLVAVVFAPSIAIDWAGRWAGLSPQPNTLGLICLLSLWANSAAAVMTRHRTRAVHAALALAGAVTLAGTNSMTSSIGAFGAFAVLLLEQVAVRFQSSVARYVKAAVGAILFGAVVAAAAVLADAGWESVAQSLGRSSDATGRTALWDVATTLISERPLLGWSFDDHATVMELIKFPYTHFHNGLLDVAVRGGFVGALLVLLLFGMLVRWLLARSPSDETALWRSFAVALVIHNVTEASLLVNRSAMWLVALVVFVTSQLRHGGPVARASQWRVGLVARAR